MASIDPVLRALGWGGRYLEEVQQKCRRRQRPWACFWLSAVLATSVGCPGSVDPPRSQRQASPPPAPRIAVDSPEKTAVDPPEEVQRAGSYDVSPRFLITQIEDVTVVKIMDPKLLEQGEIDRFGEELMQLGRQGDGAKKVLLSFSHVELISSAVLAKLVRFEEQIRSDGGAVKFSELGPGALAPFLDTKLDKLFEIYATDSEALAAFDEAQ